MRPEHAPAKVNLDLLITGRRADGYHELDSLVVFAGPGDRLTVAAGRRAFARALRPVRRSARRRDRQPRAARGARACRPRRPPAPRPHHAGEEPAGRGRARRRLGRCRGGAARPRPPLAPRPRHRGLLPLAQRLGADVPVCLAARPTRMRGIGERLEPVPHLPELALLLVNPRQPLATAAVFGHSARCPPLHPIRARRRRDPRACWHGCAPAPTTSRRPPAVCCR